MADLTLDSRPLLADGVSFEPVSTADGAWIVSASTVPVSRVSPAVVSLLRALDGRTPLRDLRPNHADSLSDDEFLALVARFEGRGLLAGAERRPPGRLTFRPPLTVQVATLRAPRVFARLDRIRRAVLRRWMLLPAALVVALGPIALIVETPAVVEIATEPLPLPSFLVVVAVLVVATFAHEAAHGMTLASRGVLPRRAGVMLFYLSPAFFVDVTNGWRLSDRRARVAVALAGPAVHATLGSAAAVAALVCPEPAVRDTLILLALASWSVVAVNLVPFVRFDGYLALMSALDIPNLRASAIRDVRDTAARILFGAPRRPRRLSQRWALGFGVLSILAPFALVLLGLDRIVRALAAGGPLGAMATLAVAGVAVAVGCVVITRGVRGLLADGARPARVACVGALLAAGVGLLGCVIPVPATLSLGFIAGGGSVRLVVPGDAIPPADGAGGASTLAPGVAVTLATDGILAHRVLGVSSITPGAPDPLVDDALIDVPLSAFYPLAAPGVVLPGRVVGVVDPGRLDLAVLPPAGTAFVTIGGTNAWGALWRTAVAHPLAVLGIGVAGTTAHTPEGNE